MPGIRARDELVEELVEVQQVAALDGKVLVWVSAAALVTQSAPIRRPPPQSASASS